MGRPKTKAELTAASNDGFHKLLAMVDELPCDVTFDLTDAGQEAHWARDKNVRDVLVHLHEWHKLLLDWVGSNHGSNQNSKGPKDAPVGNAKPFLPEPYTWKTYGDMNQAIWEKHQSTTEETARNLLMESHAAVHKLLGEFSDDDLWVKSTFTWVGGSTLGQYFTSVTVSHYDWAMKKLKKVKGKS
jgi:hypothetical protein